MYFLKLYLGLAWKDVLRLWSSTQLQIIIIAGICLPILLLLGLKRGHVADLREELVKSPSGRQVIFWTSNETNFLSDEKLAELKDSIESVDLIIPESQRLLFFQPLASTGEMVGTPVGITLYSSVPSDPILEQFDANLTGKNDLEIVVSESFAKETQVKVGDLLPLVAKRRIGRQRGEHTLELQVVGILPSGDATEDGKIGYVPIQTMNLLESFGRGNAIAEWSVAAMEGSKASDSYQKMICVCLNESGSVLSKKDREFLNRRGLKVIEVNADSSPNFFDIIDPEKRSEITVFEVQQIAPSPDNRSTIRDTPSFLAANTEAVDDLFLRWVDARIVQHENRNLKLVGVTLPFGRETGGWIQNLLKEDALWFDFESSVKDVTLFKSLNLPEKIQSELLLPIQNHQPIPLNYSVTDVQKTNSVDDESKTTPAIPVSATALGPVSKEFLKLVVPVTLMAYLEQIDAGETQYDSASNQFVEVPKPIEYTKARLYTLTIDDVPDVVTELSDREFAVLSESSRIAEIQEQDQSLQMLVTVTAIGVFLFGVLTVFNVLVDSTDRKRGTIGVLRVMGTSKFGIFFMVLFRALIIGLLAAILCTASGIAISLFLSSNTEGIAALAWKPVIRVSINEIDLLLVALGAVSCAILGAVMPAIKASRLDPFDAIMEGRFN